MAVNRAWAAEGLRSFSNRPRPVPTRFWVISLASIFILALLFIGHTSDSLPSIPGLNKEPEKAQPPPPTPESNDPPKGPAKNYDPEEFDLDENGLKIWAPPHMDALVHGVHASDGVKRKPTYPLDPFPQTPMTSPVQDNRPRPWLGAVICSAWDIKRRMLIRYTWMKMFKDVPMDQRFVISNPGPDWRAVIQQENATFGDMIVLDHLHEDDFTANTVKTVEFYRWLSDKSPVKYEFVSKMDTDLWVNARAYWDRQLLPRLDVVKSADGNTVTGYKANVNHTTIGQFYYDNYHRTAFPHGAIYTVTWDIVNLLPKLQDKHHIIAGEDVTMAWLLIKGHQKVTMAILTQEEKFEFDHKDTRPGERTPWARKGTDVTSSWHAMYGSEILAIHQLKKDDDWLMVAECFDERGIKEMPPYPEKEPEDKGEKPGYPRPFWTQIPNDFWETDVDGTLLCNGIWKLEPGVGRDMKKKPKGE
ncbi:uncharacterized protein PODANS_5_7825 [Podospora anserina S mat+]|uniref:Hexosyltransferase n=1 Tax=Podospora anserina (strain S / ATCC MYA-4624 / DSM 980 / FGSC 10383) TaxID=515849 RepID=B2AKP2_PODAN|nr:uncharacterized protein PODANS_5_7825 [Podospora anserina S mat+]CAP64495.1 unnamed protein product [Podospora anserina S mat+]CDP29892.1 Putative protein of unknown function [Podospora anserina S mat+]